MGEAKSQEKFLGGCVNFLRTIKSFIAPFAVQKIPKWYVKMGPREREKSRSINRPLQGACQLSSKPKLGTLYA